MRISRSASLPRYQQLKNSLVERLQELRPGDRMPSIRELITSSGLAHQTVVKALDELEQEGYLDIQPGRGAFVAQRGHPEFPAAQGPNGTVLIASPEWYDHLIWSVNHAALLQALKRGQRLLSWRFAPGSSIEQLAAFARAQARLDGVLVLPPAETVVEADANHLADLGVPVVFLQAGCPTGGALRAVHADPGAMGAEMAAELLAHGHRRLAFVQNQPDSPAVRAMVAGAREAARAAGAAMRSIDGEAASWDDPLEAAARGAQAIGDATGVICTTGTGACAAARALRRLGRRVPQEVSVIGSADDPLLAHADPAISVVTVDYDHLVSEALALLEPGAPAGTRTIPSLLIRRESVAPPAGP